MGNLRELKSKTAAALRRHGIDVLSEHRQNAWNPMEVKRRIFAERPPKVIFDCGANRGRVIKEYKEIFPNATIYAFEPTPATFEALKQVVAGMAGVELVNAAVGEKTGTLELYFGNIEQSNSLVKRERTDIPPVKVPVVNLADFCRERSIQHIDILKLDVEGYEMPVLRGVQPLFDARKIDMVFTEIAFMADPGTTECLDLMSFLTKNGFAFFGMYEFQHCPNLRALIADVLFVRRDVYDAYVKRVGE